MFTGGEVYVATIEKGGVGYVAGLRLGDMIKKYDNIDIRKVSDLKNAIRKENNSGDLVSITIVREGVEQVIQAKSGKLDAQFDPLPPYNLSSSKLSANSGHGLIDFLNVLAWCVLLIGIISAIPAFFVGSSMMGFLAGTFFAFVVFIQCFIIFSLLKVISTMASDIKTIKQNVL